MIINKTETLPKDLIHWSKPRLINVMTDPTTVNVWAPELFYDDVKKQYMIIWASLSSSTLAPDLPGTISIYTLQRTIPSVRGAVTTPSPRHSHLSLIHISSASANAEVEKLSMDSCNL